jgi:hypothetical protein
LIETEGGEIEPENMPDTGITAAEWYSETVDSGVDFVGTFNSIQLSSSGHPHISYFDGSNTALKYAYFNGSIWLKETVDSGPSPGVGRYTSLALDSSNHPHISYYSSTDTALKYAYHNGAVWLTEIVDGSGVLEDLGRYTSLALDGADRPYISYYDVANSALKYAYLSGTVWISETVESAGSVGWYTSLALDSAGRPHVSYHNASNTVLRYAYRVGSGGNCGPGNSWECTTVDNLGTTGTYTSLALDSNDEPHISYFGLTLTEVRYAHYVVSGGNCGPDNDWECLEIDDVTANGGPTSLSLDQVGDPHIAYLYYDPFVPTYDLRYAFYDGSTWITETVDSSGDVGKDPSITLDPDLGVHISYYAYGVADLKYAYGCRPVEEVVISGPSILQVGEDGIFTAAYTPTKATGPVTIEWDNGTLGPTAVYSWTDPGDYTITVTATGACGQAIDTFMVTVCQPVEQVTVDGPDFLLVDETGDYTATFSPLDATLPVTFEWDNGTMGPNATYSWPSQGIKTIVVTATNLCGEVNDTFQVFVCQPVEEAIITGPVVLDVGVNGTYTAEYDPPDASDPRTFTWDNGTVGETAYYSWTDPGIYTITVTITNPCGEASDTFTVTVCRPVEQVTIDGPDEPKTEEENVYTAAYTPSNPFPPLTITWNNGSIGDTAVYTWTEPGPQTVMVTATNLCSIATDSFPVMVCQPVEEAIITGLEYLLPDQVSTYTATPAPEDTTGPLTITWDNGTVGDTADYSWPNPGIYTIEVTVTSHCGQAIGFFVVTVTDCIPVNQVLFSGPDWLIPGQIGSYTVSPDPPNAVLPITYTWDNGTVGDTSEYSWPKPGIYTINVTATNPCGQAQGAYTVTVCQTLEGAQITGPDPLPEGVAGIYLASPLPPTATPPLTITWDNGTVAPTATYSWPNTGTYTIVATVTNRCGEVSTTFEVHVCQTVEVVTVTGPAELAIEQEGTYIATYTPTETTYPVTLSWDNGTVGDTAVYSWTRPGVYVLTATASSACGETHQPFTVTVAAQIYLPLVGKNWNPCHIAPGSFWESEPNNGRLEADGPLCSDLDYSGLPDDTNDWFSFPCNQGDIVSAEVLEYEPGDNGQLFLYNGDVELCWDSGCGPDPDGCTCEGQVPDGGQCHVWLYSAETSEMTYTIRVHYPQP